MQKFGDLKRYRSSGPFGSELVALTQTAQTVEITSQTQNERHLFEIWKDEKVLT